MGVMPLAVTDTSARLLLDVLLLSGLDGHHRVGLDGNIVDAGASLLVRVLSLFLLLAPFPFPRACSRHPILG